MVIGFEEIKKVLSGAVETIEKDGYLTPRRFTSDQLRHMASDERWISRAKAAAGIMLDFYTDSTTLSFEAVLPANPCFFDVYVDGFMRYHSGKKSTASAAHSCFSYVFAPGKKRITVYFPCTACVSLGNLSVDDGALFVPHQKNRKLLFFGDSITQGYTTDFPSHTYVNAVARRMDAEVLNLGIGGDVFNPEILQGFRKYDADSIFAAYGTNDWNGGRNVKAVSGAFFDRLCEIYPDTRIYAMLPTWRADYAEREANGQNYPFEKMRREIRLSAAEHGNMSVIDCIDFIPHFPEFFADGYLHPNDLGFTFLAENLVKAIEAGV